MRQKTLMKIIGLMRKSNKSLTMLEIAKRLKIGYRPVYNHITEMEKESIITAEKIGSAKQCRLNTTNPKTRHLLELSDIEKKEAMFNKNKNLKIIDLLISKLTEKYSSDILSVVLFGSHAKGNATKHSDIDLIFIVNRIANKELREAIERECAGYQLSHNLKISPMITNIVELKNMLNSNERNIGKEAKETGISMFGHETFWRIMS